jgi:hypothetical protein
MNQTRIHPLRHRAPTALKLLVAIGLVAAPALASEAVDLTIITDPPGARIRLGSRNTGMISPAKKTILGGALSVTAVFPDGRSVTASKLQLSGPLVLELKLPEIPKAPPGLTVRYERPTPASYRIVHTWNGAKPMRFITGDRTAACRHPFDFFVVPGPFPKPGPELVRPVYADYCATTPPRYSTRLVKPGESWAVEEPVAKLLYDTVEAIGKGTAAVRYCALPGAFDSVDDADKSLPKDEFWWGCVDAQTVAPAEPSAPAKAAP